MPQPLPGSKMANMATSGLIKPMFEDRILNEEQIAQLKDYVSRTHSTMLYCSSFPALNLIIYWRGMSRIEYETVMTNLLQQGVDVTGYQFENDLINKIVMHPSIGVGANMLNVSSLPAGVPSSIFREFMSVMGFNAESVTTKQL